LRQKLYYGYLRFCLGFTGLVFRSGPAALRAKAYFLNALEMFYSAEELSALLTGLGYREVAAKTLLAGMIGLHRATKAAPG
jgi:demethylmenaquinone methyltransferase/2-methoxy-6-polyprenyl-1,4-benzoquinol methylase